jgi:hypothetical protein
VADSDDTTGAGGTATRVTRTGIALVHEGELILPAAGSEAEGEDVAWDSSTVVQYVFPVEIEVRTVGAELDPDAIADSTLDSLIDGLAALI